MDNTQSWKWTGRRFNTNTYTPATIDHTNSMVIIVWCCEKCDRLQTLTEVSPKNIKCECGGNEKDGYARLVGRGPKDPMACRECKTHWPSDKKRCPGCKIRG